MKKILLILLFFLGQNVFCQEYHFDRIIQYKYLSSSFTGIQVITICFDSKDLSHYIMSRTWGEELDTYFFDTKNQIYHRYKTYDINKSNIPEYWYSFKTNDSTKTARLNELCTSISLDQTEVDNTSSKLLLTEYKNDKKKKILYQIEVIAKPYDIAVLGLITKALESHFLFCEKIKISQKGLPTSLKMFSGSNIKNEITLIKESTTHFNFTVNQKEIKIKD
ncbi:hypothetical protein [Flavobacterium sp.]|uniref:hypothetical protein n=1 Tax=Flavobacterium sp. TaxID=239 RepID=UPI00391D430E